MNRKQTSILAAAIALATTAIGTNAGNAVAALASPIGSRVEAATDSATTAEADIPDAAVADEVIWVVGNEPILKSDVEVMRLQAEAEGVKWDGNPDFVIPEQIAVQKLFLHQAAIDSIEVKESDVATELEMQINHWIQLAGSREKLEEFRGQTIAQMRQQLHDDFKNNKLVSEMKRQLVADVNVTPSEVRRYFANMPEDSIPFVPVEVEVQIITKQPKISQENLNKVKDDLRSYTERITSGETTFAALARLYSEDPGSARQGGELDYMSRGQLDPAFANVAFNLTDPKKISKIVESEYGFHIIQLVDKRGDKIKVRHILRTPRVSQESIDEMSHKLDSVAIDIRDGKYSFDEAATFISDDKDTRNNHGLMSQFLADQRINSSRYKMRDLPTEVAKQVEKLKVGEISPVFTMVNDNGKTVCAIVKLKSRTDAHRATINGDYQVMKDVVVAKEKERILHDWVVEKIKKTYVRMADKYKAGQYKYDGWVR